MIEEKETQVRRKDGHASYVTMSTTQCNSSIKQLSKTFPEQWDTPQKTQVHSKSTVYNVI